MAVRPKRSNDRSWDFGHRWPFLFCATFRLHAKTSRDSKPSLHRVRGQGLLGQRDPLRLGPGLGLIGPSGQLPEGHNHLTRGHWGHIQSSRPLPRHRVQTWVLDHAFVVLDRDDLLHQIRWLGLGLGLRFGPGVHEEPVHLLNHPPGKKVVPRALPGRVLLYSGWYSFWLKSSCTGSAQAVPKPYSLNPKP